VFPGVTTCEPRDCALFAVLHGDFARDQTEATFFRKDGTSFPAEYSVSQMRDDDGTLRGGVLTFRDVTERRTAAAAAEAERRYREAEAQNRAKDNFLATLSHELRTPMTSISDGCSSSALAATRRKSSTKRWRRSRRARGCRR